MSRACVPLALVIAVSLFGTTAAAQSPGPSPPAPTATFGQAAMSRAALLDYPAVRDELKLTEAQKKALREMAAGAQARRSNALRATTRAGAGGSIPSGANELNPLAIADMVGSTVREGETGLDRVLTPRQSDRLDQIRLQREGLFALVRPEVATAIHLRPEQSAAIASVLNEARDAELLTRIRPPSAKDRSRTKAEREADQARVEERSERLESAARMAVQKILSKTQRDRFKTLLGPPFDASKLLAPGSAEAVPKPPGGDQPAGQPPGLR